MNDESKPRLKEILRFLFGGFVLGLFGAALFASGWNGLSNGEITVFRKLGPSYVAYATGPHAAQFTFEVTIRLMLGGILSLLGFGVMVLVLFSSPEKRNKAIRAAGQVSRVKRGVKIPWWLATAIFLALFGLLLRAIPTST